MGKLAKLIGLTAGAAALDYGAAHFFCDNVLVRDKINPQRVMRLAGVDLDQYLPRIQEDRDWLELQSSTDIFIPARDGIMLHATWYTVAGSNKAVACFHSYASQGSRDFTSLARYYLSQGLNVLVVDNRAHGKSEGEYIGFGALDRWDILAWIKYLHGHFHGDYQLLLHGVSMGATSVLMASGQKLPANVKGVIADSAFTCAWELFGHILRTNYHLPATPLLYAANLIAQKRAHYDLRTCNAAAEAAKSKCPILLAHGENDSFAPMWMCDEIYQNTAAPTKKLIVPGAGHMEAYHADPNLYEQTLGEFIAKTLQ